eukprot:3155648-Rhodomonas_salina.1
MVLPASSTRPPPSDPFPLRPPPPTVPSHALGHASTQVLAPYAVLCEARYGPMRRGVKGRYERRVGCYAICAQHPVLHYHPTPSPPYWPRLSRYRARYALSGTDGAYGATSRAHALPPSPPRLCPSCPLCSSAQAPTLDPTPQTPHPRP